MEIQTEYLHQIYSNYKRAISESFPIKILVSCCEESLYYFNKNLLTPSEFLNALEIETKQFSINLSGNENLKPILIKKLNIRFYDFEEFDNYNQQYYKLNLMKTILENSPNDYILKKLENQKFTRKSDLFKFLIQEKNSLNWNFSIKKILLEYTNRSLAPLGNSLIYKPFAIFNIFLYNEKTLKSNVTKKSNYIVKKYKEIFGKEIWEEERHNLIIINIILFDISKEDIQVEDKIIEENLEPMSEILKNTCFYRIPINNPQKLKKLDIFNLDFDYKKFIYLKNKIESYKVGPFQKIEANSCDLELRGKNLNVYDIMVFKDNIEKIVKRVECSIQDLVGFLTLRILEIKKSKKKSFWSIFGNSNKQKEKKELEMDYELAKLNMNLAEFYFLTNNYNESAKEYKILLNTVSKKFNNIFESSLEFYIYSLMFENNPKVLFSKIDGISQKMTKFFLQKKNTDILKCSRLSCLLNLIIKIGKHFQEKEVLKIEKTYLDFEREFNFWDISKTYDFLKPFFKEEYTYSLLFDKKKIHRRFLFMLITTADYYSQKQEEQNFYYTLYLYLITYNFYKTSNSNWKYLFHFITQTLARLKEKSGSIFYSLKIYIEFLKTYKNNKKLVEGEKKDILIYLERLTLKFEKVEKLKILSENNDNNDDLVKNEFFDEKEILKIIKNLELFEISNLYDIKYSEFQNTFEKNKKDKFNFEEFFPVIDKNIKKKENCKNKENLKLDLEIIYSTDLKQKSDLLEFYIKEIFLEEKILFEIKFFNNYNIEIKKENISDLKLSISFLEKKNTKKFSFKNPKKIILDKNNDYVDFGFENFKITEFGKKKINFYIKVKKEGTIRVDNLYYKIFGLPYFFDFNEIHKKYKSSINYFVINKKIGNLIPKIIFPENNFLFGEYKKADLFLENNSDIVIDDIFIISSNPLVTGFLIKKINGLKKYEKIKKEIFLRATVLKKNDYIDFLIIYISEGFLKYFVFKYFIIIKNSFKIKCILEKIDYQNYLVCINIFDSKENSILKEFFKMRKLILLSNIMEITEYPIKFQNVNNDFIYKNQLLYFKIKDKQAYKIDFEKNSNINVNNTELNLSYFTNDPEKVNFHLESLRSCQNLEEKNNNEDILGINFGDDVGNDNNLGNEDILGIDFGDDGGDKKVLKNNFLGTGDLGNNDNGVDTQIVENEKIDTIITNSKLKEITEDQDTKNKKKVKNNTKTLQNFEEDYRNIKRKDKEVFYEAKNIIKIEETVKNIITEDSLIGFLEQENLVVKKEFQTIEENTKKKEDPFFCREFLDFELLWDYNLKEKTENDVDFINGANFGKLEDKSENLEKSNFSENEKNDKKSILGQHSIINTPINPLNYRHKKGKEKIGPLYTIKLSTKNQKIKHNFSKKS